MGRHGRALHWGRQGLWDLGAHSRPSWHRGMWRTEPGSLWGSWERLDTQGPMGVALSFLLPAQNSSRATECVLGFAPLAFLVRILSFLFGQVKSCPLSLLFGWCECVCLGRGPIHAGSRTLTSV